MRVETGGEQGAWSVALCCLPDTGKLREHGHCTCTCVPSSCYKGNDEEIIKMDDVKVGVMI